MVIALRLPWPVEFANFMLLGFGFYLLHGCIQVYVTELAPPARGSAIAVHSMFFFLGQAAGPVVYGVGLGHCRNHAACSWSARSHWRRPDGSARCCLRRSDHRDG